MTRQMVALFVTLVLCFKAVAYETLLTVAKDGTGDYQTIQDAINATKTFPWHDITIKVKNGVYNEKVNLYAWNTRVKLVGESRENTIIRYNDHFKKINLGRNSTFHTYTLRVAGNDFTAANLTIENTAGPVGQAVALHVEADRAAFYNVSIKGFQDTVYVAGEGHRSYFKDCHIEGTVDFIFGGGTAVFEDCNIHSLRSNTYVTAASTPENQTFGLVFNNCHFTATDKVSDVYLGRPWRQFAKTMIINSQLDKHIHPVGWHNWDNENNEETVEYKEANNSGQGAKSDSRVTWTKVLMPETVSDFDISQVYKDWEPSKNNPFE
ncbi:pectinesterase family protein [Glaciecola sp. 1036]|uniref:pectinesterase family protein n=1 Tax=Alteromonadaceae TaxID=72275 RepID=UPI003D041A57